MKHGLFLFFVLTLTLTLVACGGGNNGEETTGNEEENTEMNENMAENEQSDQAETKLVTVELHNTEGQEVGTAELEQTDAGVLIRLEASELSPGTHGFHIHETGMCEAPKFESAGGHFNPTDASHGFNHEEGAHAGDLPNLEVGEDGSVQEEVIAELVTLKSDEDHSLLSSGGTALVIHEEADDYSSQPAGDAGDRIVCGVISK